MKPAMTLLAMIPLAFAATFLPDADKRADKLVVSQIVSQAQAGEVNTFAERWWPGDGSFAPQPLTFEQRWEPVEQAWGRRVKTISITKPPPEPSQAAVEAINTAVPLPPAQPATVPPSAIPGSTHVKPRPIRVADLCAKHGMHKQITNNGRSWKCRK